VGEGPALTPGYRLAAFDELDSTNDEAKRRADDGAPDGTVIWARSQSTGRGRRGRQWASPPGNLYCSILVRPAQTASAAAAQYSFIAALAALDALVEAGAGQGLAVKWPNDLLLNQRKVAGILLESSLTGERAVDWIVAGVGVNLTSHPEIDAPFAASDLMAEGCAVPAPDELLTALVAAFDRWQRCWAGQGFEPVREAWLARAMGRGKPVRANLEGEAIEGRFADLAAGGELIIELGDGTRRAIAAGDITFTWDS
jgi:BirA family transcriptional regulator, biotin operon repressor / biotin---[acetyl-CoA-carboxylase] ligase